MQNFFHPGIRNLTLQSKYMCLFKNPRDAKVANKLASQMSAEKDEYASIVSAHKQCTSRPFGYTFVDLRPGQNDNLRIRNNIFPNDCIVYSKK